MINLKENLNRFREIFKIGWKLFAGYRKYIFILTFLGILSSFAGAIGVNALIPLFSFFSGDESFVGTDFVSQFLQKAFLFFNLPFTLPSILILITILFTLKSIILYLFDYIKVHIQSKYQEDMMNKIFKSSLNADWSYLMKQKLGYLETVISVDVARSTQMLDLSSNLLMLIGSLFVYISVALNISQAVTLMTLVVGILLFLVFKPLLYKARQYAIQHTELNKEVAQHINEHISGIKTVKANGVEGEVGMLGGKLFEKFRFLKIQAFLIKRIAVLFVEPVGIVFVSVVVLFTYYQTSYNLGALIAIVYLIRQIFNYIQNLQNVIHTINETIPYTKEVLKYQKQAEKFQENKMENGTEKFVFKDRLKFENVIFDYENKKRALNNISFEIKKGEMVGFIGPSGGGKSTIFDLILRFFNSTEGRIILDNKDVKNISIKDWRKNIAYVPQDIFLLNDTIRESIRFRNKDITEKKIVESLKAVHIYDFVKQLPQGLDTIMGEKGLMLSGGQRQRIVIARALARDPQIMLLDEATSALDKESEKIIQKVLEEKSKDITILTIAHRLSTVRNVDKLIVVEDGKILEMDTPDKLLEQKGTYFSKIYNMKE